MVAKKDLLETGLPLPLVIALSMGAGISVSAAGTKILFKNGAEEVIIQGSKSAGDYNSLLEKAINMDVSTSANPGSIFNTVEYPMLQKNPYITNIFTELLNWGDRYGKRLLYKNSALLFLRILRG